MKSAAIAAVTRLAERVRCTMCGSGAGAPCVMRGGQRSATPHPWRVAAARKQQRDGRSTARREARIE